MPYGTIRTYGPAVPFMHMRICIEPDEPNASPPSRDSVGGLDYGLSRADASMICHAERSTVHLAYMRKPCFEPTLP